MFSDELKKYSWADTTAQIAAMTDADVRRALARTVLTDRDFMALISPAAEPYLELMARRSRAITEQRFGKVVSMYIPMYITNSCTNSCVYCGFNRHNRIDRVVLTPEQIECECKAIKQLGPLDRKSVV